MVHATALAPPDSARSISESPVHAAYRRTGSKYTYTTNQT
jgi:hypothetical protein